MSFSRRHRIVVPAALALAGSLTWLACSSSSAATFTLPPGAQDVQTSPGTCDAVDTYVAGSALDCQGLTLSCGKTWYLLCDGARFVACSCSVPQGFQPATTYNISASTSCQGATCQDGASDADTGGEDAASDGPACIAPGSVAGSVACCQPPNTGAEISQSGTETCYWTNNSACTKDSECGSRKCSGGKCAPASLGGVCATDDDCSTGKAGSPSCDNGVCTAYPMPDAGTADGSGTVGDAGGTSGDGGGGS